MRAAILLVPLAALAAASIAGGQKGEPAEQELMDVINNVEAASDALEAATAAAEAAADAAMGNVTEAAPARPAWLSGHLWLYAAEAEDGPVWYFDPMDSDFAARPHRVVIRVDETPDPARTHNNTLRIAEIDCAAHHYRILSTTHYDDAGNAVEANERGDGRLVPVAPGSVLAGVEQTVCAHVENQGTAYTNGM